jgi:hypothetical protein
MHKPHDATPYASLRQPDAGTAAKQASASDQRSHEAANDFAAEAEKLKQLREALWAAFEAGPAAGLPNTLIDLTMAYTNALRLQLNLTSVSVRQLSPRQRSVQVQRTRTPAE